MSKPGKKTVVRDEILSTAELRKEQQLGDDVIGRIASGRIDHGSKSAFQPGAAGF
jgi:hypothetical protein